MVTAPDSLIRSRRHRLPILLQRETAECGLACLAMIASCFGRRIDLDTLRNRHGPSSRGATLADLMHTAGMMKLTARPLRVELAELHRLRLPAIVHWRTNHFVVLVKRRRRRLLIHDPACGRRQVTWTEFRESFSGVALELRPAPGFRRGEDKQKLSFGDFAGSFRHLYCYLALMLCLLLSTQALALVPPIATQILIDELVLGQDRQWLYGALGGLGLVMLTGIMLEGLRRWTGLFAGTRLAVDSSVGIMHQLFSLPTTFFRRRHAGDLISKLDSLAPIREALTDHVINSVVHASVLITTFAIMFAYSGALTAVSVAGFALSLLIIWLILPRSRRLREQALVHTATQNNSLLESIRACDVVKSLGLEHVRLAHWQKHFAEATNANVREGKLAIARDSGIGIVGVIEQVLFLGVGITGVLEQDLTLGVLFAFLSLRTRFGSSALGLADTFQQFFMLKVHTGRLSDIALAKPEAASPAGAIRSTIRGSLKAENVGYAYEPGNWIIREFSCNIAAGSNVVITGPSGCGKTTLLKLLAGHLSPGSGQLYVDNMELSLWHRDALRRQTAFVLQNDALFQGTITENISAFDASPDLARVCVAAVTAEIWDDIQALPMKLETQTGDNGRNLSGGQVQRLLVARALYRKPRILFLDEATSHLDVATERRVLQNVSALGITVVNVAHRPDVIKRATKVIELAP